MGKQTTTYKVGEAEKGFYFPLFKTAFNKRTDERGARRGEFEQMLGGAVGVSSDAVHQWRNARSAPCDLALVAGIAKFLCLDVDDLLCEKEKKMERLNDRQRDAVARVYREIEDYLYFFEQADGFVWKRYRIQPGNVFNKYASAWLDYADEGGSMFFKDGVDLALAAWSWVFHALEREWIELGDHPIYEALSEFIDEALMELWNGKTDPDYRFDPPPEGVDTEERSVWAEASRARKQGREIVERYW